MRKIEKPTIKHTTIIGKKQEVKVEADSPYGVLDEVFPEAKGKLIYVSEDVLKDEDNFRPPAQFFVSDALGGAMFFRTNSRANAQKLADYVYGGKYKVKIVVKAAVR